MNCEHAERYVAAYADGEVEGRERRSIARHLRDCPACAAKHEEILALRARLRSELPYFAAPPALQERVRAQASTPAPAPGASRTARRRTSWIGGAGLSAGVAAALAQWRWVASGALAGCMATMIAFVVGTSVADWRASRDVAAEAVLSHVRATLDRKLVQVATSDRHTVKPWLSSQLDYSPPVHDLASEGFPLVGGRIDSLDGRPVATLVYRAGNHVIDVFVRPASRDEPAARTLRGFHIAHARSGDWDWLAVSDVTPDVLAAFVELLARTASSP